jgi:hypothetical protein
VIESNLAKLQQLVPGLQPNLDQMKASEWVSGAAAAAAVAAAAAAAAGMMQHKLLQPNLDQMKASEWVSGSNQSSTESAETQMQGVALPCTACAGLLLNVAVMMLSCVTLCCC